MNDTLATTHIPVYEPFLAGNVVAYVNECLTTGWISSRGPFISRFEQSFADYVGAPKALGVCNGTVAIHLALAALGVGPDDEVIVPSFTYIASVNTILQTGAKPIYADSNWQTLQVDADAIERAITPRTKAIVVVHLYGHPCDMDAIVAICRRHDLFLIEDCAEAFGTRWKGQHVGTFGDAATFSFYGNKTITTGEGGMVLARDEALLHRCRYLRGQAVSSTREYWHDELGYNYRMTNIVAAIGLAQLEIADEILARKRRVAESYRRGLTGLPLRLHEPVGDIVHSYWMCSLIVERAEDRDPLRALLANHGIETRPFFWPAHLMPHTRFDGRFPVAEALSASGMNLPSFPSLRAEQIDRICSAIASYFGRAN